MDSMTEKERNDFGKVAAPQSNPDRLPGILAAQIAEIRGYIVTWSQNTLSADASLIPHSMLGQALAIVRMQLLASIPGYDPGDTRKQLYQAAIDFFKRVADGKIRPQPAPDAEPNPVPTERPSPLPKMRARERLFTRRTQDGI